VAIGTTVVRALETVTDERGTTSAGQGWTDLVITSDRPLRVVNALITGLHEPHATHLTMLERAIEAAALGAEARSRSGIGAANANGDAVRHMELVYREASEAGYLWHEFGDSHLIVGKR
jgi:S-adenosylmethionine:tRNA ribosyltransferase-isomerase